MNNSVFVENMYLRIRNKDRISFVGGKDNFDHGLKYFRMAMNLIIIQQDSGN
jgi:hypothetical protein